VLAKLAGVVETKVRPTVVIASESYLAEHPDVIVGILTTRVPAQLTSTDHILADWAPASLRQQSCFRMFVFTLPKSDATIIGHLSSRDTSAIEVCARAAFAL